VGSGWRLQQQLLHPHHESISFLIAVSHYCHVYYLVGVHPDTIALPLTNILSSF
jgi:hypothetical protein